MTKLVPCITTIPLLAHLELETSGDQIVLKQLEEYLTLSNSAHDPSSPDPRFTHILYLSILKPGSNTCRSSNIYWVVQQNERNKCLRPFKCWVPKLSNLINLKMMPNVKEN